jgi:hypothetical protein
VNIVFTAEDRNWCAHRGARTGSRCLPV